MENVILKWLEKEDVVILSKDMNSIMCTTKNFGRKRVVRIPMSINDAIAFLCGTIIGDGHLGKTDFLIRIEMVSKEILELISNKIKSTFLVEQRVLEVKQRSNWSKTWKIGFDCKLLWLFFNKVLEIPAGKKSSLVKVPKIIMNSDIECKRNFIVGLFLTDGSFKKKAIRFVSASEELINGLCELLKSLDMVSYKRSFKNLKFNKSFFELIVKGIDAKRFKLLCPETLIRQGSPSLVNGGRY